MRITYTSNVISPIRHPMKFERFMEETKSVKLYIAISGLSAHVTGAVVGFTEKPVIGVPVCNKTRWYRCIIIYGVICLQECQLQRSGLILVVMQLYLRQRCWPG